MRKAPCRCVIYTMHEMRNKEMLSKATGEKPHYIQKKKDTKVSKFFFFLRNNENKKTLEQKLQM